MTPNPTILALIPFEGPADAPSVINKICNDGDEKGKELALAVASQTYHEVQKKGKTNFLPRRNNYPGFTQLTKVQQATVRLYLNTRVDR